MIVAGFTPLGQCGRPPGVMCPVHNVPTAVTQSGLQHVCVQPDCEFHVRLQGPQKAEMTMSPKAPLASVPNNADKAARKAAIDEAVAKKKAAKPDPTPPPPAEKPKKAKADAPPKADAKPKAEEPKKEDDDMMSVSDVARELGLDPKRARAKLRAGGQAATEGRWPKVKRGSKKYQELVALLAPEPAEEEEEEEESEEEEDEE